MFEHVSRLQLFTEGNSSQVAWLKACLIGVAVPELLLLRGQRVEDAAGDDVLDADQARVRGVAVIDDALAHLLAAVRAVVVRFHLAP